MGGSIAFGKLCTDCKGILSFSQTPGPWIRALQKNPAGSLSGVGLLLFGVRCFYVLRKKLLWVRVLDSTYSELASSVVMPCCSCDCCFTVVYVMHVSARQN